MFFKGKCTHKNWGLCFGQYLTLGILTILVLAVVASEGQTSASDSLKLITVISRHGNRGANKDYPLDPYPLNDTAFWPYGPMQLTPYGRVQAYNLGLKLRSMYDGFLPVLFHSEDVFATSDLVERVVLSGQLVLAGLYPPVGFQIWNSNINWQPIALYTNDSDRSEMLNSCPRYNTEANNVFSQLAEQEESSIANLSSIVYENTGVGVAPSDIYDLYDKIVSEDTEGYILPEWISQIYPDPLEGIFSKVFNAYYIGNDEIVRLSVGNLFEEILENMESKARGSLVPDRKLFYYSGHDNTILGMEVALGVQPASLTEVVQVGSALVIELHQMPNTGAYFVQVVYIDGSTPDLDTQVLPLPLCGDPCELEALVASTDLFTEVDFDLECQQQPNTATFI